MSTTGRKRDPIWVQFEECPKADKKGKQAKCKECGKLMEPQVQRMQKHLETHNPGNDADEVVVVSNSNQNRKSCVHKQIKSYPQIN